MPPVKSFLRQTYNTNVVDLTSGHSHHDAGPLKIHDARLQNKSRNDRKPSNAKSSHGALSKDMDQSKKTDQNYMELDEFLLAVNNKDDLSKSDTESNPDFPKPTVDLLASLLTLGKMIQNQKQLIQNQTDHQNTPSLTLENDFVSRSSSIIEQSRIIDPTPMVDPSSMVDSNSVVDQEHFEFESNKQSETLSRTFSNKGTSEFNLGKEDNFLNSDTNTVSKRKVIPEDIKDKDYWNRRKRNNLAAKKSREERRKKELEILETTTQLEKENSQLTSILKRLTSRNEFLESRLVDIRNCNRTEKSDASSFLSSSPEEN